MQFRKMPPHMPPKRFFQGAFYIRTLQNTISSEAQTSCFIVDLIFIIKIGNINTLKLKTG
jgi:hypothetical protein